MSAYEEYEAYDMTYEENLRMIFPSLFDSDGNRIIDPDYDDEGNRKSYYERNKEKIALKNKEYRENNREKMCEYQKIYRENNQEKIKAYKRTKVQCDCGAITTKNDKAKHERSKYHTKIMNKKRVMAYLQK